MIDPCIPADRKGFTVTRRYRGAEYHITVQNPGSVQHGIKRILVDGVAQESKILTPASPGGTVKVEVVMG